MTVHWADEDIEYDWEEDEYPTPILQKEMNRKELQYLDYYEGWYPEYDNE